MATRGVGNWELYVIRPLTAGLATPTRHGEFLIALEGQYEGKRNPNEKCNWWKSRRMPLIRLWVSVAIWDAGKRRLADTFCLQLAARKLFYICGRDILAILLREISKGFACGIGCDLDSISASRSGQIWGAELYCKNGPRGKWVSSSLLGNKYTANYE